MEIEELYLKSFRSYQKVHISLHPHLNIFYGPNAVGKSNVLEAIGVLALGKSFRGSQDKDMVCVGNKAYHIACKYKKNDIEYRLSYGSETGKGKARRKIKRNQDILHTRRDLIGGIICVIFSPSDITIAEGSPLYRRRFLDTTLSYQNRDYLQSLILFNQALRQRNATLKNIRNARAKEASLEVWDLNVSKHASILIKSRLQFIDKFRKNSKT